MHLVLVERGRGDGAVSETSGGVEVLLERNRVLAPVDVVSLGKVITGVGT